MAKILTRGKQLVGLDGKTPLSTKPKAEVLIQVKYTAAGGNSPPQYLDILKGEVDGDMHVVNGVLNGAMTRLIQTLVKLGAVAGTSNGPQPE